MKIIGVTGGSGAGKSMLCTEMKKCGATIVDSDKIAHDVMQKNGKVYAEIVKTFGREVLDENLEINRKTLGKIVFGNKEKLELLNNITHKHIFERMNEEIHASKSEIVVLDVPLLFQEDFPIHCDMTVAVTAPEELRIERITKRDGIDAETAKMRISNQMSAEEYNRLADICFLNDGDNAKVQDFARKICGKEK